MKLTVCNVCGKDFDQSDKLLNACFVHTVGYGSEFDGQTIELDLCCKCHDKLLVSILGACELSPFQDFEP